MFSEPFMLIALAVGILSGCLCAYLGNYVIMKEMTFISMALSEVAALGIALSMAFHIHPFHINVHPSIAALAMTFIAVLWFWKRNSRLRSTNESVIGILYVSCAALAVILLALHPRVESHGIDLVSGNLLYCTSSDLLAISIMCVLLALVHWRYRKQFLFVAFDRETAKAQGIQADRWDLLLMLSIGLCIAICMKLTGVLFVFASMIIPGMTGLAVFKKVNLVFTASVFTAAFGVLAGTAISYYSDLPTSPTITVVYTVCFLVASGYRSYRQ